MAATVICVHEPGALFWTLGESGTLRAYQVDRDGTMLERDRGSALAVERDEDPGEVES